MRLIGRYLDREILFDLIQEENGRYLFKTQIPPIESGSVILELFAIDVAGNIGTRREALVLIDFKSLEIRILESGLLADERQAAYMSREIADAYTCRAYMVNENQSKTVLEKYQVVKCL